LKLNYKLIFFDDIMIIYKILDLIILVLVSIFFIGMLDSEFPELGIVEPLASILPNGNISLMF